MRLLLVEDDRQLAENMVEYLEEESFVCKWAADGEEGEFLAIEESYDVIILDINLPFKNGFEVARSLREKKIITPILILTARGELEDKIKGLSLGADDYLVKPFSMSELAARVQALIRRSSVDPLPVIAIDGLEIEPLAHRVRRDGKEIETTSKEFAVLEFLARHRGQVVTRSMILDHVWGSDFETMSNVIDVYIRNLRRKIDIPGQKRLIQTIRGTGYLLGERNG